MTVTITRTSDGATTTPTKVIVPISETDQGRNIVHKTLDGGIAVSLIRPDPPSGEMTLLYWDEASARTSQQLHRGSSTYTLEDTVHPARNKVYVVKDPGVTLSFDEDTRKRWTVVVPYQEIVT